MEPMGSRFYIGMDTSGDKTAPGEFFNAPVAHELCVEFIRLPLPPHGTVAKKPGRAARLIKAVRSPRHILYKQQRGGQLERLQDRPRRL